MSQISLKRMIRVFVALMLLVSCATACAETARLSVQGFEAKTPKASGRKTDRPVIASFQEMYPGVKLTLSGKAAYPNTGELLRALGRKDWQGDVFTAESRRHDLAELFSSGYCLPLTDDPEAAALLSLMHPSIADAVRVDGQMVGLPVALSMNKQLYYLDRAWQAAGLTAEDVPTSYTDLLDFLDAWATRAQRNPIGVSVSGDFDADAVKPTTYTDWLLGILLRGYVDGCGAAGVPLNFDNPTLIALMERTKLTGARLYELREWEAVHEHGALFTVLSDAPQSLPRLVPTRLTDQDPMAVNASVTVACVRANSANPEMARRFIVHYVTWMREHTPDAYGMLEDYHNEGDLYTEDDHLAELSKALLFADATGPIHSANPHAMANVSAAITRFQSLLDGAEENLNENDRKRLPLSAKERQAVQESLEIVSSPAYVAKKRRDALDFTEEELARYQEMARYLTFTTNDGFDAEAGSVTKLLTRYASGGMTAEELVGKLNEQIKQ